MKDLYILGAGGCGREVLSMMLDAQAIQGQRWNIKGFLDDTEAPLHGKDCALPQNARLCGGLATRRQAEYRQCLGENAP